MTIVVEGSPFGNGSTTWYLALDPHPQTYDWPSIGFWPTILWHIPPKLMLVKGPNSCWLKGPRFWWKIPISDGWIASNPKFLYGNTVTWFNMVEHPATQLSMVSTCLDHSPFLSAGTITVPQKRPQRRTGCPSGPNSSGASLSSRRSFRYSTEIHPTTTTWALHSASSFNCQKWIYKQNQCICIYIYIHIRIYAHIYIYTIYFQSKQQYQQYVGISLTRKYMGFQQTSLGI